MRPIDADALIGEIKECIKAKDDMFEWKEAAGLEEAISCVNDAPTIEERKTGKWIYHDDDDWRVDTYHCSECRNIITVDSERRDDIGFTIDDMKWCNNCGADMREEGEAK